MNFFLGDAPGHEGRREFKDGEPPDRRDHVGPEGNIFLDVRRPAEQTAREIAPACWFWIHPSLPQEK